MITFKPVIRNVRSDGYAAVYIRVTKDRETDYIKTNYTAKQSQLKGKNLKDYTLISKVSVSIEKYISRLNNEDTEFWTVKEVVNFLLQENDKISFTIFYKDFVQKMRYANRNGSADNYQTALNSLTCFSGKKELFFSDITSKLLTAWIESLGNTKIAKNHYPVYISAVFKAGTLHYNDYERGILRIKNQPFMHVSIPDADIAKKRAVEKKTLLKIFNADISGCQKRRYAELGKDIATLIFYLAGINTIDLYNVEKQCFRNMKLCYNRTKTKGERSDNAYIEIAVQPQILPLFEKYAGKEKLFCFCEMYNAASIFNGFVNSGLSEICNLLQIAKVTSYTFRHSWATIAQNNCEATTALVAFALNHSTEYRITKGYIKTDFSPIDKLNEKVLKYVFEK